ncbi:MAG: OB-fold domain-containing protein [Pseudomonadota bacterium]
MTMIAENLVVAGDPPRLIGGQHKDSGKIVFPLPSGSEGALFDAVELSPEGTLWSWSVQRFLPKSPPYMGTETLETFQPFVFGYVELPRQIIVETRIVGSDGTDLKIGMPMRTTLVDFDHKERGTVQTFAFTPA